MDKTKVIIIFDGYCVSFMKLLFYLLYYFYETARVSERKRKKNAFLFLFIDLTIINKYKNIEN